MHCVFISINSLPNMQCHPKHGCTRNWHYCDQCWHVEIVNELFITWLDCVMGYNHHLILHRGVFKLLNLINELLILLDMSMCFNMHYTNMCFSNLGSFFQFFIMFGLFYKLIFQLNLILLDFIFVLCHTNHLIH
jgi:hypothetical protein